MVYATKKTNRLFAIMVAILFLLVAGCTDDSSGTVNETNTDGDTSAADGDQPVTDDDDDTSGWIEDGDLDDTEDDVVDIEASEDETETADRDSDRERIEFEEDINPCEGAFPEPCFINASAETEGYRCFSDRLLFCSPAVPQPPACSTECKCNSYTVCNYGCEDPNEDGTAFCSESDDDDDDTADDDDDTTDGDTDDDDDTTDGDTDDDDDTTDDDDDTVDGDNSDDDDDTVDGDTGDDDDDTVIDGDEEIGPWVCMDDILEPNDTLAQSRLLDDAIGETLSICQGDYDWLSFTMAEGDTATVRIEILRADQDDLDLVMTDDAGATLVSSSTANDFEEVEWTALYAGTYHAYVRGGPFAENDYSISITITYGEDGDVDEEASEPEIEIEIQESETEKEEAYICPDDTFEDNDVREKSTVITGTSYSGLRICPDDTDWYELPLLYGDKVTVDVLFSDALGDINVYIYDPLNNIQLTGTSTNDNEHIPQFTAVTSGNWRIRVFGKDGVVDNPYTLVVDILPSGQCFDDEYEPNNNAQMAAPIAAGNHNLVMCPYNSDFYEIVLAAGDSMQANVIFSHADGNLEARLWTAAGGDLLAESRSVTDNELITYTSELGETVHLQIFGYNLNDVNYGLSLYYGDVQFCMEDMFETNDDFDSAYTLLGGEYSLMVCQDNLDYWAFDMEEGAKLDLKVEYTDIVSLNMDIRVYKPNRTTIIPPASVQEGKKTWEHFVTEAGRYYMRVNVMEDHDQAYMLNVNLCPEDQYEPNGSIYEAAFIAPGSYSLGLCRGDEDWFSINVDENKTLTCTALFSANEGDLDMYLRNGYGQILAESTTSSDNEQVVYQAQYSASYYLQIVGFGSDTQNTYDLICTVQ